jgi:hypothetical protein
MDLKMNKSMTNQQSKTEPKWQAITSLVLGGISILGNISSISFPSMGFWFRAQQTLLPPEIGWLFPTVGLVLGIMGLKYMRKKLVIGGIVLSSIGLMTYTLMDMLLRLYTPW